MQPPGDSYVRSLILEITSRVAAGFLSAEVAADQIMRIVREHSRQPAG
jgi:hypothetical protein